MVVDKSKSSDATGKNPRVLVVGAISYKHGGHEFQPPHFWGKRRHDRGQVDSTNFPTGAY